ncbi:YceD family protein [Pseudonocardia ailaonensis]|uniref:YceD family protein n=1 Tax=Pseudonocardia ailaonensis TaxID=367279 RepID=A0ABN2NLN7_9PSEU
MSTDRTPRPSRHEARAADARAAANPWVFSTRELARRPGIMRTVARTVPGPGADDPEKAIGLVGVLAVPPDSPVELDLRLESVTEGVYVSGTARARLAGECSRCLDELDEEIEVRVEELFAYPDSVTEATTDEDEIPRLLDERFDIEPTVRDAIVLELPLAPLCRDDCPGLCQECGGRRADLGPDHGHETLDPRWAALRERLPSD